MSKNKTNFGLNEKLLKSTRNRVVATLIAASLGLTACATSAKASETGELKENKNSIERLTSTDAPTRTLVVEQNETITTIPTEAVQETRTETYASAGEDKKEEITPVPTAEPEKEEEIDDEQEVVASPEDLVVNFTNYALKYDLTAEEINAILFAMNGEMNLENSYTLPDFNANNFTVTLNKAVDKILNKYYENNNIKTFDLTKAIITTTNAKEERKTLKKYIKPISKFKKNPNNETFKAAILSVNDIIYSNVSDVNGTVYLQQNQRDLATRLYSNYLYGYAVNNGFNTNSNKEIMNQLNEFASIPYTFTYDNEQLNCDKVYEYMK